METNREDIYTRVTNQIIAAIEAGAENWRMPWHITEAECFSPLNAVSKRPYRGINVLTLWAAATERQYESGFWATYNQWQQLGAQVRKGEHATTVVLWKPTERPGEGARDAESTEEPRRERGLFARGFSVFNLAQVEGYQPAARNKLTEGLRIQAAEQIFFGKGARIEHGGARACYDISNDCIQLPRFEDFRNAVSYYATLAHELTHWTGAKHRLDRDLAGRFGSASYAAEELVAELGAAFLCAQLGLAVEPRPDHAGYIAKWLELLRNDKKAIFTASSKAQQAADWLLNQESSAVQAA